MDSGPDAQIDAGPDGAVGTLLIHRNAPGGVSAQSAHYRLVRSNGRSVGASSMNFRQRDAVHGGSQP